jgi:predicted CXXCH cytochrome family protein
LDNVRTELAVALWLTALCLAPPVPAQTSASGTAAAQPAPPEPAAQPLTPAEEVDGCLGCHGMKSLDVQLARGETLSLFVDQAAYSTSTHRKLACSDCHGELKGVEGEHAKRPLPGKRDFAIAYSAACKKCHFQNFTDAQASVHQAQLAAGKLAAAVCSDCHGAHDITPPAQPRSRISRTCASCHQAVATAYGKSVHGQALLSDENVDVPACTDCHRSHDIADPRTGSMRVRTPDLCGSCHTNERIMSKYKLSTKVVQTYLSDFHGVTVRFQKGEQGKNPVVAVCTDCHGVHDITRVKSPDSKVLKENLLTTCRKCHPDAKADFPASWMSHYEPSLEKAPLVYLVKLFYLFVIPFMIGGLALQILLHLWRLVVNR